MALAGALAQADGIAAAEVARPGLMNLRIEASAQGQIVANVLNAGSAFGNSGLLDGRNINLAII